MFLIVVRLNAGEVEKEEKDCSRLHLSGGVGPGLCSRLHLSGGAGPCSLLHLSRRDGPCSRLQKDNTALARRGSRHPALPTQPCAKIEQRTPNHRSTARLFILQHSSDRHFRGKNWLACGLSASSAPCAGLISIESHRGLVQLPSDGFVKENFLYTSCSPPPERVVAVSKEARFFNGFVLFALSAKSVLSFSNCFVEHDSFSVASGGILPCGHRFQGFLMHSLVLHTFVFCILCKATIENVAIVNTQSFVFCHLSHLSTL